MRNLTQDDYWKVFDICLHAVNGGVIDDDEFEMLFLDISGVAKNYDIDMDALLAAPDYDFAHDIRGIRAHIDRKTGLLADGFVPRCLR